MKNTKAYVMALRSIEFKRAEAIQFSTELTHHYERLLRKHPANKSKKR